MVGISRAGVVRTMTGVAVGRGSGIHAIDMTACAGDARMGTCQRKASLAVIEGGGLPCCCRVAYLTISRKLRLNVVRVRSAVEVVHVARRTRRTHIREVAVHVAGGTSDILVCARQGKRRLVVIERCGLPATGRVADRAVRRETGLDVVRVSRPVEILHVARRAIGGCTGISATDVALGTLQVRVHAGQREAGEGGVVELGSGPGCRRVTYAAVTREPSLCVIRSRGGVEILLVTAEAGDRRVLREPADVARSAIDRCVNAGQRKAGVLKMVKRSAKPTVHAVAFVASDRESRVVEHFRSEVCGVAGVAVR